MSYIQNNTRRYPTVGSTTRAGVQGLQDKVPTVKLDSFNILPKNTVSFLKPIPIQPPEQGQNITESDLIKHNRLNDCWVVYKNQVFDITDFVSRHPGYLGPGAFINYCGTTAFENRFNNSSGGLSSVHFDKPVFRNYPTYIKYEGEYTGVYVPERK